LLIHALYSIPLPARATVFTHVARRAGAANVGVSLADNPIVTPAFAGVHTPRTFNKIAARDKQREPLIAIGV
jgi:glutamine phosphoribosylpyrophosphate amidotransferase